MEFHRLDIDSASAREQWDQFCARETTAWFWHTTDWLQYTLAYQPALHSLSLSFFVTLGAQVVAIVPLFLERHEAHDGSHYELSFGGGSTPAPALSTQLPLEKQAEVLEAICQKIDGLAREYKAVRVRLQMSPLCWLGEPKKVQMEFDRYGYVAVPLATQVVALDREFPALLRLMRKGHAYDVKRGMKHFTVTCYDAKGISEDIFARYRSLHAQAAGRVTRPSRTFELMQQWIREGKALLLGATTDGVDVGWIYLFIYKNRAYYGSACNHPEWRRHPVGHALQGRAFQWLVEHGCAWYELGVQQFGPLLHDIPTEKELAIAVFKRGFGGDTVPLYRWEKFYSREFFVRTYGERVERYAEAVFLENNKDTEERLTTCVKGELFEN
jgi:GNAT superfamily N-acetyltransferase